MAILQRSVTDLKGVGSQLAAKLANLQIKTIQDVLFHLPTKYVDRTRIHSIATVRLNDTVVVEGSVTKVSVVPKPKRSLTVKITDGSGDITLKFFHFNMQQQAQFKQNVRVRCFGQIKAFRNGLQIIHPEYKVILDDAIVPVEEHLTPIYASCDGVSQNLLRNLVRQSLAIINPIAESLELLPVSVCRNLNFISWHETLQLLHAPPPDLDVVNLQKRMAFEELLAQHLILKQKRQALAEQTAYALSADNTFLPVLLEKLPFALTAAQTRVINTISVDMQSSHPMVRLVQGDVGSGKTLVAVAAALQAIAGGKQVAFMAPTEILAEQHWRNISKLCQHLKISVSLLTGKMAAKEKQKTSHALGSGQDKFIIGTHALLQDNVVFKDLALVIIDEQHRFGVDQRLTLRNKGMQPHQLILTATPIPRTLAMTFHADMDYAVIDELPPGRKPIETVLVNSDRRTEILQRIRNLVQSGQQVYWVCTIIEQSEVLDCTPAEQAWQDLCLALPDLKIGLLHGRMKSQEKDQVMQEFSNGNTNVLVATTVIEVGVDVPNASLMVIENPERLGLAQLHQLRGRVGRGNAQSYCVLLYKTPLSERSIERLKFLRDSNDGFAIAEFDLQMRGPGEFLGTKQSGVAQMRIADLVRDRELLPRVSAVGEVISQDYPELIPKLIRRWIRDQVQYAVV